MAQRPDNNDRRDLFAPVDRSRRERPAPLRGNGTVYPRRRRRLWRLVCRLVGVGALVVVGVVAGVGMGVFLLVVLH